MQNVTVTSGDERVRLVSSDNEPNAKKMPTNPVYT
jgi:hypothetical protein